MKTTGRFMMAAAGMAAFSVFGFPKPGTYPVFDDQHLEKPSGMRQLTGDDFKINPAKLEKLNRPTLNGPTGSMVRFGAFLLNDEQGRAVYSRNIAKVAATVNRWDFDRQKTWGKRYVYTLGELPTLSLIYAFSGNRELGEFIRGHVLQVARLPMEFWLHSELRGYNKEKPEGMLETSSLTMAMARTMSLVGNELFNAAERREIDAAIREKGWRTLGNFLENKPALTSNFAAVVATGYLVSSRYFNDDKAVSYAIKRLKQYLDKSIEDDGSYGEGSGYLSYPITAMLPAVLLLTPDEREALYGKSGFRNSTRWLAYLHFFRRDKDGRMSSDRMLFSDNGGRISNNLYLLAAHCYGDVLGTWIAETLSNKKWQYNQFSSAQICFALGVDTMPEPKSPAQLEMPLVATFTSGESVMRSGWEPDGIVLGMMRATNAVKTGRSHRHPESNSIAFGAYGEYFVVLPGSASYRSKIHSEWDTSTKSANTVLVDGHDQLPSGKAESKILTAFQSGSVLALAQDSAASYKAKLKNAVRIAVYLPKLKVAVVYDDFASAKKTKHEFEALWHFNNREHDGKVERLAVGEYLVTRPRADLAVSVLSPEKIRFRQMKGYMHTLGARDYSPGGPGEGFYGSSIGIGAKTVPTAAAKFFTVFQPLRKGEKALPVKLEKNTLKIGDTTLIFNGGTLVVDGEKIKLF